MTRESIRAEVIEQSYKYKNLLLSACTGVGKTFMSISFIEEHLGSGRVLFVLPQVSLIENTKNEFIKFSKEGFLPYIDFCCYASLHKYIDKTYDLLCLDEVHNGLSDNRLEALSKIKCIKRIAMTATITDGQKQLLDERLGEFKEVKVSLEMAVDSGILAQPKVVVKYVELDDTKTIYPYKYKTGTKLLTAKSYYTALSSSITYFRDLFENEGLGYAGLKMKNLGASRMRWLADYKEPYIKQLLEELSEERLICFAGSVDQAKRLGGKNVCSADITKKSNQKLIEDFNEGRIDKLFSKNMLQEGINLTSVSKAIICQLGNGERQFVQSAGRCLRSKDNPTIYLFIVKETCDERFLKNATAGNSNLLT